MSTTEETAIPDPCALHVDAVAAKKAELYDLLVTVDAKIEELLAVEAALVKCRQTFPWIGTYIDWMPPQQAEAVRTVVETAVKWWRRIPLIRKNQSAAKRLKSACHDFCNTP